METSVGETEEQSAAEAGSEENQRRGQSAARAQEITEKEETRRGKIIADW